MHPKRFLAFAVVVVASNNLFILWQVSIADREWLINLFKVVLASLVIAWAIGVERIHLRDIGFGFQRVWRSVGYGLLAGLLLAGPALLFLAFPLMLPQSVRSSAFSVLEGRPYPLVFLIIPLANLAAIFEEFLFRGLIQFRAIQWLGPIRGIGFTCLLFVLWHVVSAYQGLEQTNLGGALVPLPFLYAAITVPLVIGGAVFSLLRYRTGNLAGSIVAHWLVVTLLQGLLVLTSMRAAVAQ